jgi:hypothetical protein
VSSRDGGANRPANLPDIQAELVHLMADMARIGETVADPHARAALALASADVHGAARRLGRLLRYVGAA